MMLSRNLFCHLLICAVGPVAAIISYSTASESGLEDDCKFLFEPYSTQCINPNQTIQDLLSSKGLAAVCSNSLTHRVVDMENGTVEFSLLLPHNALNEWIFLFALEPRTGEDQHNSCSHNVHGKHSYFQLLEESENQTNCSSDQLMEVTWKANYLYSGCYLVRADLPSPDPERSCSSKPFYIQTDFEMEPLAYQNLSVARKSIKYLAFRRTLHEVVHIWCCNPLSWYLSLVTLILLLLGSLTLPPRSNCMCLNRLFYVMCLTEEFCDAPVPNTYCYLNLNNWGHLVNPVLHILQSLECSCDWKKPQLECTFHDLPVGNYCVQVEALDTRCVRDTVWVSKTLIEKMNNTEPCVWEICNLEIKNNTDKYIDAEFPKQNASWLIVVFALGVVSGVCLLVYMGTRKNRVFRPRNTALQLDIGPCEKLVEPPEVLLLYARDCGPFMDAMVEFRNVLERTMDIRVLDIWDDARREEMDVSGETRVLNILYSENTPVVIMATPVSRALEEGFLTGNRRYYLAPDSRDEIFLSAFHASIRMTATHSNRCRKFIVARMNSVKCTKHVFTSFNPLCTIYTLPTHLDRLLLHILNAQSLHSPLGVQRFDGPFRRKAVEFEKYVATNPSYLDSIVEYCL